MSSFLNAQDANRMIDLSKCSSRKINGQRIDEGRNQDVLDDVGCVVNCLDSVEHILLLGRKILCVVADSSSFDDISFLWNHVV